MNDIRLRLNEAGRGAFYLQENQERLAEMEISVSKGVLTVYHTEVAEKLKGKGVASELLKAMVSYAREKNLKVVPLCPYVHSRFKKDPEAYADLWKPGNL
ncbi:MAG: N-acetyltransferase [Cyclobacteriaceae bacterium]|jgi:predicted GNAT family acetyltransferase|nr:N-acetyltransferase [Cyclobacteriaceae bacterium]